MSWLRQHPDLEDDEPDDDMPDFDDEPACCENCGRPDCICYGEVEE